MKNKLFKSKSLLYLLLFVSYTSFAVNITVFSSDNNAQAKNKVINAFKNGGTLRFQAGNWTISLNSTQAKIAKNLTIIGANTRGAGNPMGAFEANANVKTIITFKGASPTIQTGCKNLEIRNLKWVEAGIRGVNRHQPIVNFNNVIFDINTWAVGYFGKRVLAVNDGVGGTITNTSFRGFGFNGIGINRSVGSFRPVRSRPRLIVDRCLFIPDAASARTSSSGMSHDAGNDEFAATINHNGSQIKNSRFIDCRIGMSKGSNMSVIGNRFILQNTTKDAIHFEEFTNNITINRNTFDLRGNIKNRTLITLGGKQTSENIRITNNTVIQTNQLSTFVTASGAKNITITGNTVRNPRNNVKYLRFWGCNNIAINSPTSQPGLGVGNREITTSKCAVPFRNGNYYVKWGNTQYLTANNSGVVTFVNLNTPPSGNQYKWNIVAKQITGRLNYYTFKNVASGKFLEVYKGPTRPEQKNFIGKPYTFPGGPATIDANAVSNYNNIDRQPGFAIFKKNGNYALLPGGNELRSQIRKAGNKVRVYGITDQNNANYSWKLVNAGSTKSVSGKEDIKANGIYPNPTNSILNIDKSNNLSWNIFDIGGRLIKQGISNQVNVSEFKNGLYVMKLENGEIFKFVKSN